MWRVGAAVQSTGMADVTRLLDAAAAGDRRAAADLLPLVYDELRRLAAARMAREAPGQTLDATALVHEAYLRLVGPADVSRWEGRGHFFAAAAEAMRRILVDNARRKRSVKHGGGLVGVQVDESSYAAAGPSEDIETVDEALTLLAQEHPHKARLVELRYFAGLTIEEAAKVLDISCATAERDWTYARAWLFNKIHVPLQKKKIREGVSGSISH